MVFEGDERVTNGGLDADKLYWNVALGLKASFFAPASPAIAPDCVLETKATATRGPLTNGTTAFNTNYPYVRVSVPINSGSVFTCSQHGLDEVAPHAGVKTWYTGPKPDGTGFATATFGHVGAPTAGGITTNPVNALVNECLGSPSPCAANASCQDLPAGFVCSCNPGFSGNGLTCTDTNGCLAAPCFAGVTCTDVAAPADGRICGACPFGMTGDGVTCVEIDACVDHPCGADGDCVDTVGAGNDLGGRTCFCDDGYEEDSAGLCVDIDECEEVDACFDRSTCVNEVGGFSCECLEGTVEVDGQCVSALTGYAYIPAGTFEMGSPTDEVGRYSNETQHPVTLTRAFWMKQTEVTQGEWVTLMGANPSGFASETETDRPLERMSWFSAIEYANRLSQASGLTACYVLNTPCTGTAADGTLSCQGATFLGLACKGFRLPTEAEWEYAARAGTTGPRYGVLDAIAWYLPNSGPPTHPVARKAPNAWGLHDMLGNVWEFTADWYGDYSGAVTDPTGPVSGTHRVFRGGGYGTVADDVRAAARGQHTSSERDDGVGFRLVRTVGCPVGTVLDAEGGCVSILAGYSYIPNGTFVMGSPTGESGHQGDEVQHEVTLTRPFWMKQTEVTQSEWSALMGANPSSFQGQPSAGSLPVEQMSWFSAVAFANATSTAKGLPTCYDLTTPCTGDAAAGSLSCAGATFVGLSCKGYRLPTESEWEYAARAGTTGPYYGELGGIAIYGPATAPAPVGSQLANAWGLYDMLGNVWEWTWDGYGAYSDTVVDPTGPVTGALRGLRGGGWNSTATFLRAARRNADTPANHDAAFGFRLVRTVGCPVGSEMDDTGGCDPIIATSATCGLLGQSCPSGFTCDTTLDDETSYALSGRGGFCVSNGTVNAFGSGAEMVFVPAGTFWMGCNSTTQGGTDANCQSTESPQHEVTLSTYTMDRAEVSTAQYKACATTSGSGCTVPSTTGGDYGTYDPPGKQTHPVNNVNWSQASAYCAWRGKRLCTESEWERGARGGCETVTGTCQTSMRKYPWGNTDPTCSSSNFYTGSAYCEPVTYTADVGGRAAGASPYGALNLSGNVWEWSDSWYVSYPGATPTFDWTNSYRVPRGGAFGSDTAGVRAGLRDYAPPANAYYYVGFRCCRSYP